jgi:hypothetical protein
MYLYRILQLEVFVFCPWTRTSSRQGDAGIQDLVPSLITLTFRSTRNQRGNCDPILVTVRLYRFLQLEVFVLCPFTRTSIRLVDAVLQGTMPSLITLIFRSTWNERGNCNPVYLVLLAPLLIARIRNCTSQVCIFFWCPATSGHSGHSSPSGPSSIRHGRWIFIIIISDRRRKTYRSVW